MWRTHLDDPSSGFAIENARQIVTEASLKYELLEERMGELYAKEVTRSGKRTSSSIALTQMQAALVDKRVALLQAAAILPSDIRMIRHIEDLKNVLSTLARILDEEDVPQRVWERLFNEVPPTSTPAKNPKMDASSLFEEPVTA